MPTILAAGATAATSSDVTLTDGATANLVAYFGAGVAPVAGVKLTVFADTAGQDSAIAFLDPSDPETAGVKVTGPGTFRVARPKVPVNVGVDSL